MTAASLRGCRVLVTGATGFVGAHLAARLVALGAEVHATLRESSDPWRLRALGVLAAVNLAACDLTEPDAVRRLLERVRPSHVLHLAAAVNVARDPELVPLMLATNVQATYHLLAAAMAVGVTCFVNTGSSEEYGESRAPFRESEKVSPVSPYSWSKAAATELCTTLHRTCAWPLVTVRPFLTYGPLQTSDMLVPATIRHCLHGRPFPVTAGEQTRDFNYVADIVEGYLLAATVPAAIGGIFNLGSGREHRVREVVAQIAGLLGRPDLPQYGALPYRPGEVMHFYCDNSLACRVLGWQPRVELAAGLERTVAWYRAYEQARGTA